MGRDEAFGHERRSRRKAVLAPSSGSLIPARSAVQGLSIPALHNDRSRLWRRDFR